MQQSRQKNANDRASRSMKSGYNSTNIFITPDDNIQVLVVGHLSYCSAYFTAVLSMSAIVLCWAQTLAM